MCYFVYKPFLLVDTIPRDGALPVLLETVLEEDDGEPLHEPISDADLLEIAIKEYMVQEIDIPDER